MTMSPIIELSRYEQQNKNMKIDESLFAAIGQGDKDAFLKLYKQTAKTVYAYSLSILRNTADAEDAMQETFLKIRSSAHLYHESGKPMAWIFTIARNICLMKFRKEKTTLSLPLENAGEIPDFGQIKNAEDRMVIKALFSELKEDECQIILLHSVSGMKHREISELMQIPLPTVLSKYNRGLKKLRTKLEERS